MMHDAISAAEAPLRRLYVYNGGFLAQTRVRRILRLAGWDIRLGAPGPEDWVGVWGMSPTSHRGERVAERRDTPILRVEDAFLRSVLPGRDGAPPIGLLLDRSGVHFNAATPSDLETLLATHPLDDTRLLHAARVAMARLADAHLSKYNAFHPDAALPKAPYVLVIDQTAGDASIAGAGADALRFKEMLYYAKEDNPGQQIVIKTHPETLRGHRKGHFDAGDAPHRGIVLLTDPVSPWALMQGATAVYTVSSGMGFEAILAGHKPCLFGQPFYAGWGLTVDRFPIARRQRKLTRAQLFAAAMILYPTWYDPYRDRLTSLDTVMSTLDAEARAWRDDHAGYVATGMRLWKRKPIQDVFGGEKRVAFVSDPKRAIDRARKTERKLLVWANKSDETLAKAGVIRVEDGFLRSRGLGADLVPPLSLVLDDHGIYYDPTTPSRLERLITAAAKRPPETLARADALIKRLTEARLSKYNLGGPLRAELPKGMRILVPGQVEDDASIRLGGGEIRSNRALLEAARAAHPDAVLIYKPHPDVEAGLRDGRLGPEETAAADMVAADSDPIALIDACDAVWTMTSLLGFEALLRGKRVTCLGAPFYAGWGLTQDLGPVPARRTARPSLSALVHATLIEYPRYYDPVTRRPCHVEVVVDRLQSGTVPRPGPVNRALAKLQGAFASHAWLWR